MAPSGRARHVVRFRIQREVIDIFLDHRPVGLIDRDTVRLWLTDRRKPLTVDDVALAWDGQYLVLETSGGPLQLPARVEAALRQEP